MEKFSTLLFLIPITVYFSSEKRPNNSKNLPILCVQKIILLSNARPPSFINSMAHSSEIRSLSSTKCWSEKLQNLLYFMCIFIFHFMQLYVFPYECPRTYSPGPVKLSILPNTQLEYCQVEYFKKYSTFIK